MNVVLTKIMLVLSGFFSCFFLGAMAIAFFVKKNGRKALESDTSETIEQKQRLLDSYDRVISEYDEHMRKFMLRFVENALLFALIYFNYQILTLLWLLFIIVWRIVEKRIDETKKGQEL